MNKERSFKKSREEREGERLREVGSTREREREKKTHSIISVKYSTLADLWI